jgi:hypothetical protein
MDEEAKQRMAETRESGQKIEKGAFHKLKTVLNGMEDNDVSRQKLIEAAKIYYNNAQGETPWSIAKEEQFKMRKFSEQKELLLALCSEAINRDMIAYIMQGKRGTIGSQMYKVLR